MAILWPGTLPQLPLHDGYSKREQSGLIRDEETNAYIGVRRRFTATSKYHDYSMVLTKSQLEIFIDFFENIIGYGSLKFDIRNPVDFGGTMTCRILIGDDSPYTVNYDENTLDYLINFILEELPGTVPVLDFPEYKVTSDGLNKVTSASEFKVTDK